MTNKTIGMVTCPLCNQPAAVRKNKNNKFYYISRAGLITPSAEFGQAWFVDNATIWGDADPPGDAPDWIREDRSNPANTTSRGARRPPELRAPTAAQTADAGDELDDELAPADADDDDDDSIFGGFI